MSTPSWPAEAASPGPATDPDDPELVHTSALAGLDQMGPNRLEAVLAQGGAVEMWEAFRSRRRSIVASDTLPPSVIDHLAGQATTIDPWAAWAQVRAAGVEVTRPGDPGYPPRLLLDPQPPPILYRSGAPVPHDEPAVAVVGTRRCTRYGHDTARALGRLLADAGVGVVSGLALGIDAAAHHGALSADPASAGSTTGVVASGVDIVYPRRNRDLWWQVRDRGRLFSEVPPGHRPLAWRFVARNRIIAALAQVVVVVESHATGGALHTADFALEAGRPVYAVPGPVSSPSSSGTNHLIEEGARMLVSVDDFVAVIAGDLGLRSPVAPARAGGQRGRAPTSPPLSADAVEVLDALGEAAMTFDALVERSGLGLAAVSAALDSLAAVGAVGVRSGWFERVHP